MAALRAVEREILSFLRTSYRGFSVPLGPVVGGEDCNLWTIALNEESPRTPLVLMPGFASGLALWCLNLDHLATRGPVLAFDLLGFGRSSRPKFSKEAELVEEDYVESLEAWRKFLKVEQMVLLGHSLGGYLASAYALKYPHRLRHLILADPWGFPARPANAATTVKMPLRVRAVVKILNTFNPLSTLRLFGPLGPSLIWKVRPDLALRFTPHLDPSLIIKYIYQCNSQTPPTGEVAFKTLVNGLGWAERPMLPRLLEGAQPSLPITFIYGATSWIKPSSGEYLQHNRKDCDITVNVLPDAAHHVYADSPFEFCNRVLEACSRIDDASGAKTDTAFRPLPRGVPIVGR